MKIPKKILSIALCTLLSIGGSQLTLLRINAQDITRSSTQANVQWEQGIKLELKNKNNSSRKEWCEIKLICKNGKITLESKNEILREYSFVDTFVIGVADHKKNGETEVRFRVTHDGSKPANQQLKEEIDKFNKKAPTVGDSVYMHGLYYNNTFQLSDSASLIKLGNDSYSRKYSSIWDRGYRFENTCLREMVFRHTPEGVSLASKAYW